MHDAHEVTVRFWVDGNQWGAVVGPDPITGVAGFGASVNEAMTKLVKEMQRYHRNWIEFADQEPS